MSGYEYNAGLAFQHIVGAYSERPALRLADGSRISYAALNALSNRFARVLIAKGLRRRGVIGIVHTKTLSCYAVMLAALKIGAAYVNLDDQNPSGRLAHIFRTANPDFVFGEPVPQTVQTAAHEAGARILDASGDGFAGEIAAAQDGNLEDTALVTGADPAYVMYTSGSTGVPKGALMTHANVLNFRSWVGSRFSVTPDDVFTNVNPMYFDNSVFDFYGSLLNGACMVPVARETLADGAALLRQVEAAGCSVWFSVPSMLIYLSTMKLLEPERLASIRTFVFGGEGYPKPELRKLFLTYGKRSRLINVYGPTECTCICSAWDVRESDLETDEGLVTLGPVAENFSGLVLDPEGRPVSAGGVGELCLLGPQVGLGYVNDPDRTASSFAANPLNERWREPMYRTGDLVRLYEDGTLDFVGRKDNQVKHMGYRIELEEIEAALNKIEGVSQSAVLQKRGRRDMKMLVAYVAAESSLSDADVRAKLEQLLPPYMIPQRFEIRESLPKNPNGKVDRVALAAE